MKENQKQRPNRQGSNNPMYGKHHSMETRQKQSDAAIKRNQEYKQALHKQHHITMDEFLSHNPSVKEYISHLVKQQIEEMIWNKNAQRI